MTIEIRQEEHGDVHLLALSGRLDTETSADLELALQDLRDAGATRFVIDLGEIGYVSSAGLRVLLALAKQLDGGRGSLKLCALNDAVRQVFDVAGFSRMFAIFRDRDAALGAAAKAPPEAPKAKPESADRAAAPARPKPAPAAETAAPAPPPPPAAPARSELTRAAERLLGAEATEGTPSSASSDLARSAAELLDPQAKPKVSAGSPAAKKPKPAAPKVEKVEKPRPAKSDEPESSSVLGKFRNLFGKK